MTNFKSIIANSLIFSNALNPIEFQILSNFNINYNRFKYIHFINHLRSVVKIISQIKFIDPAAASVTYRLPASIFLIIQIKAH